MPDRGCGPLPEADLLFQFRGLVVLEKGDDNTGAEGHEGQGTQQRTACKCVPNSRHRRQNEFFQLLSAFCVCLVMAWREELMAWKDYTFMARWVTRVFVVCSDFFHGRVCSINADGEGSHHTSAGACGRSPEHHSVPHLG